MAHHRILGTTVDLITGKEIIDTDDERIRQRIARFLIEKKGFHKNDIESKVEAELICGHEKAKAVIDFAIKSGDKLAMIIKYGPGSIVSRERPAIASAKILENYVIPFAVVTNGEDAVVIDTNTAYVIYEGLDNIPSKNSLEERLKDISFKELSPEKKEKERRFLFVYEAIEHSSECDDEFCITKIKRES